MPFNYKNLNPNFSLLDELKKEKEQLINPLSDVGFFRVRTANQCIGDAKTQPIPKNLYHSLLFENEITFLFADTGIGKSVFAVQIANEISKTEKVLYFDLELSDKQFQSRYSENYQNEFVFSENLIRPDFVRPFKVPDGVDYDEYFIDSLKGVINRTGAKIVIIDNMTKLISSDTDKATTAKPLMDSLTNLKFEYGLTLLLLEHTRKTDLSRPISLNDLQGSKMKANFADAAFSIGRSTKDKNIRYVKQLKCRSSEIVYDSDNVPVYEIIKENSFLYFSPLGYDAECNHLKQPTEDDKANRKQEAADLKAQGLSNREIARRVGVSEGAIRKWLK
ncbi:MAG: AAA family ATPase [Bacteroidales bacterium]|nr:AAA family ATPase [Bacteroidales bacterium]